MYKCINGIAPDNLAQSVKDRKLRYSYYTRSLICSGRNRIDWGRLTFSDSGARLWNNLQTHVKNSVKVQSFKVIPKRQILENPLYIFPRYSILIFNLFSDIAFGVQFVQSSVLRV